MEKSQEDLPYFKIFPKYLASVAPGQTVEFDNITCYHSIKLSTVKLNLQEIELTIEHNEADNILCHRSFVVTTGSFVQVKEVFGNGAHTFVLTSDGSPEQDWDLFERGPRVFVHQTSPEDLTYKIGATFALFEAEFTMEVPQLVADMNREFMKSYIGIDMEPRGANVPEILDIPEHLIQDGDTFNIIRLNGLAPMIAWAMGAATGHTVVALWREDRLYLCESTTVSECWPTNGIQCNPYSTWVEWARKADMHAVWAPLDRKPGAPTMDRNKAWDLVDRLVGNDYGYEVVLMGWLDTIKDNLPCLKDRELSDFCLEAETFELLFAYIQRVSFAAARVFVPAVQQRAGVPFNSTLLQAYYNAHLNGVEPTQIFSITEKDGWLYETTRDGKPVVSYSMVCNVFVCNVWKAGGLFNDADINCGDSSVNDNYKLKLYQDPELRPDICKEMDPENPLCQITGRYSLRLDSEPGVLPRYNYIPVDDIGDFGSCPSMAPDYLAPHGC